MNLETLANLSKKIEWGLFMRKSIKLGNVLLMSSMILGLIGGTGITSVSAAALGNNNNVQNSNQNVKGVEVQTKGVLTPSGSAMSGLKLEANNQVTYGTLDLDYKVTSAFSANFNDQTTTVIKLPTEFNTLAESGKMTDFITSAHFSYRNTIGGTEHDFTKDEMKVKKDDKGPGYLLMLTNPRISGVGIKPSMDVHLALDLGQMVTTTGIRIPNAIDKSAYHMSSTITSDAELINWEIVGNTDGSATIPVAQLDPGYDLLHSKPTIETPVNDTDTVVSGKGIPGATVTIKNGAGTVLGTGVVDKSGGYKITIPAQNAGVTLLVTQNTGVGESEAETTIVQHSTIVIPAPKVDQPIVSTDKIISGTGTKAGDLIRVTNYQTHQSGTATVQDDLTWTFNVPNGFLSKGNILQVTESTNTGETSEATLVVVN